MSKVVMGVRILLGLAFTVFGLNGFLQFMPMPEMSSEANAFMGMLMSTGTLMVVKALETIAGLALLSGKFVPLSLLILAPILVNIWIFHIALDPANLAGPIMFSVMTAFLGWAYRSSFSGVLNMGAQPG